MKQKNHLSVFFSLIILTISLNMQAQNTDSEKALLSKLPINSRFNHIMNRYNLKEVLNRLSLLKKENKSTFTIVHIGDSHLQAGSLSEYPRKGLQAIFGNAGRGIVFPYQLAKSNSPIDLSFTSNAEWKFNRLAHPEINLLSGVAGFIIQSDVPGSQIQFKLKNDSFNRLKIFFDANENQEWKLVSNNEEFRFKKNNGLCNTLDFKSASDNFSLTTDSSNELRSVFGFSLERDNPGLIYHSIGINGAKYEQYNMTKRFWEDLPALKADLYIVSLGTNEAQKDFLDEEKFKLTIDTFLMNIKAVSPSAQIIITTAADSYKRKKSNQVIADINNFLVKYCDSKGIPYWDLYRVTNGHNSCTKWNKAGLMSHDKIHFTAEGYKLQGILLYNALMEAYREFEKSKL